jgi:hypothetical protein
VRMARFIPSLRIGVTVASGVIGRHRLEHSGFEANPQPKQNPRRVSRGVDETRQSAYAL